MPYWDEPGRKRAVNELTLTEWDPVSKQPHFKYSAVKIRKGGMGILDKIEDAIEDFTDTIKSKL